MKSNNMTWIEKKNKCCQENACFKQFINVDLYNATKNNVINNSIYLKKNCCLFAHSCFHSFIH